MNTLIRLLALPAAIAIAPAMLGAQGPEVTPEIALLMRADSITLGEYCDATQRVLAVGAVIRALEADSTDARSNAAIICDPLLSSFSLLALSGGSAAPMAAVARLRTEGSSAARAQVFAAMSEFRAAVRSDPVRRTVQDSGGPALSAELTRVTETAQQLFTLDARDRALTRLSRYERKLGPRSARLNFPEVLFNYAAQRWVPGFRPTPLGGPSPWEVVASYVPGYATIVDGHVEPVSASEFGLRRYLFGESFGQPGLIGLVLPSYWSVGVVTASDRNGALVWPWQGADRSGAFVSWGTIKLAYINRDHGTWLMGKQFQIVPFVF
ncbi:MAG TPA: hypothetical protein VH559_10190 [Gemmatimonadaceae bacterium]